MNKPQIKIGYLVSCYPAVSHTFILSEVQLLRKLGFEIKMASINPSNIPEGEFTEEEKQEFLQTFYVKKNALFHLIPTLFKTMLFAPIGFAKGLGYALYLAGFDLRKLFFNVCYFAEALIVGWWMRKHAIHHLHIHFANPASNVGMLVAKVFSVTFSLTVHGPDVFYSVEELHLKEKVVGATFVCCVSYFTKSQLERLCHDSQWRKFEVTPLGVDLKKFSPRVFEQHPSPFRVMCVGRLTPSKGQHVLLMALESLIKENGNIQLRLIGEGPDRQALEKHVEKAGLASHVTFEGAVSQKKIRDFYAATDLFVLSSFAEGVPVALMEAMAMEIPCIAPRIHGIPELIRDKIDGLLVIPANETDLAFAMKELIGNPEKRQELAKAGRRRVLEKYDLETNVQSLASVFQKRLYGGFIASFTTERTENL